MNIRAITPFILQTLVYPLTWFGLRFFTNIRIGGRENLRGLRGGAIFAVNHASELDPILIPATLPFLSPLMPMFYLARDREFYEKKGLAKYFYGGLFFKFWGAYPVFVGTGDYAQALRHHVGILLSGHSVCVFPEGGKTHDGTVREGKPGVAYLLWRTGRPVVPVAIHGHYGMCAGDFLGRTRTIAVSYGKPITREELFGASGRETEPTKDELKEATAKIMARIREMYQKS